MPLEFTQEDFLLPRNNQRQILTDISTSFVNHPHQSVRKGNLFSLSVHDGGGGGVPFSSPRQDHGVLLWTGP